jgi:hypothetical protein
MMGAEIRFAGLRYQFSYYFFFALLFLLSAFSEELFFRGVIFQAFMDEHKYIAAVIMSMLFSLSHLLNPNVNFIGLINVFLVGLLLSFMFIESLSLWLPVTFHFLWNLLEELALDSPVSGYRTGINIFVINIDNSPGFIKFFFGGEFGLEAGFVTTIIIMINFVLVHKLAVYSPVQAANMFKKNYYESLFITNNKVLR